MWQSTNIIRFTFLFMKCNNLNRIHRFIMSIIIFVTIDERGKSRHEMAQKFA
jgi:hypothetical protein